MERRLVKHWQNLKEDGFLANINKEFSKLFGIDEKFAQDIELNEEDILKSS